ncbi:hypothetical protein G9A89_010800 [Geosiphon pyriformis]|nr:hypothetical protein G9A89_010800 [Geosiphon pyriformis]
MEIATSLAREKGININSNLKRQRVNSDQAVVIKEILMDTPKKMIITALAEFSEIKLIKIQLIGMWQKNCGRIKYQTRNLVLKTTRIIDNIFKWLVSKDFPNESFV